VQPFNSLWMRSALFWDITQLMVNIPYRRFRDNLWVPSKGSGNPREMSVPTYLPTKKPNKQATNQSNDIRTDRPTDRSTEQPSSRPTKHPTNQPSNQTNN